MRYELTIPEPTPSLNRTQRRHWTHGYKLKKRWQWLVWGALMTQLPPQGVIALNRARVTVTRYAPYPIRDRDNLYGGCKPLIDAIKRCGLIVDDDAANVDKEVTEAKLGKGERPHTVITPSSSAVEAVKVTLPPEY